MSEIITTAISDRICQHMNKDHGDAVLFYAQVYGKISDAESAQMLSIDPQGMDLAVEKLGESQKIRIIFERTLESAKDAHNTLVEMLKVSTAPS
jgi:putative heme iron utilization protein